MATDYDGLLFREDTSDAIYLLDLTNERTKQVVANVGFELSVSPDGHRMVFNSGGSLYVANVDGTGVQQVTHNGDFYSTSWSPNGRQLVYTVDWATRPPTARNGDLYVFDFESSKNKRINPDELSVERHLSTVGWLSSGHQVLFRARKRLPGFKKDLLGASTYATHFDLYLIKDDGTDLVNLTNGIGNVIDAYPSPNGRTVMFTSYLENEAETKAQGDQMNDFKVFLLDVESGRVIEVMSILVGRQEWPFGWSASPWSPDSKWVLLPPRVLHPDILRSVKPDGTLYREIVNLSYGPRSDVGIGASMPRLSPDGGTVAGGGRFDQEGRECLCAVDTDGTDFRVLVPNVYVIWLIWSPDSKTIFFQYTVEEFSLNYQYGIVNADGSDFHDPFANLSDRRYRGCPLGALVAANPHGCAISYGDPSAHCNSCTYPHPNAGRQSLYRGCFGRHCCARVVGIAAEHLAAAPSRKPEASSAGSLAITRQALSVGRVSVIEPDTLG
jgi:Tol biopolymer transport system component